MPQFTKILDRATIVVGKIGGSPFGCSLTVVRPSQFDDDNGAGYSPAESTEVSTLDSVKNLRDACNEVINQFEESQKPKAPVEVKWEIK